MTTRSPAWRSKLVLRHAEPSAEGIASYRLMMGGIKIDNVANMVAMGCNAAFASAHSSQLAKNTSTLHM
jgi:hypothetical protein